VLGLAVTILHCVERTVDRTEIPVTDQLKVLDGVLVEAAFPKPFAFAPLSTVQAQPGPFARFRIREVVHREIERPRGLGERLGARRIVPNPHVARAKQILELDLVFRAGQVREVAVPGAIAEEFAPELPLSA
jgi:hypothetical protein